MKRIRLAVILALMACIVGVWAADELQLSIGWTYNKNGRKRSLAAQTIKYDVAGNGVIENVQSVPITAGGTALVMGAVTTPGWGYFKNLGPTNYVEVGYVTGSVFVAAMKLNTNEVAVTWMPTNMPYARSHTAAVKLDYAISDR